MENILIIHHNDRDGLCSAAIIYDSLDKENAVQFSEQNYTKSYNEICPLSEVPNYSRIYIVDYSVSTYDDVRWLAEANKLTLLIWIDHHESSLKLMNSDKTKEIFGGEPKIKGYRINGISAAALCWMYVNKKFDKLNNIVKRCNSTLAPIDARRELLKLSIPSIIFFTHRYDIWDHDEYDMDPLYFNYGDYHDLAWWIDMMTKSIYYTDKVVEQEIERGKFKYAQVMENNNTYCERYGFETKLKIQATGTEYSVFAVNKATGNSLLFGDRIDKYDIVCVFQYVGPDQCWRYSIYTAPKSNINAGEIALMLGGGGHPHAAGFRTDYCLFD